ncbi:MAG: FAD-binding oxidoreductase [Sciscionella sp.]
MGNQLRAEHRSAVELLQGEFTSLDPQLRIGLAKNTSNLFRFGRSTDIRRLDVSRFAGVIEVDPVARTADVGGMTTYVELVDATLAHGLMPSVVPQLKTITIGGAIAGLGIESSSYRNGLPHESVLELEVLCGDGEVRIARPDGEHAELFAGFPNSYGTLGYTLRCTIELQQVKPYVKLRHVPATTAEELVELIEGVCATEEYAGERVDFVDGTVFTPGCSYLTLGTFTATAPYTSDYTGSKIYYTSIADREVDYLTVRDYLWRWDTDWFWCSRALGVQHPLVRALWPRSALRSDVYRKLVALDRRFRLSATVERLLGKRSEMIIQDVEVPLAALGEFLSFFHREVGIEPIWLCPLRLRSDRSWPLYPLAPGALYVNVGFWSSAVLPAGASDGYYNRMIEDKVTELDGHKSLYSTSFYDEETFAELYNGTAYAELKQRYDPAGRLPGLYAKCVQGR